MTDSEVNEAVAKKLGWKLCSTMALLPNHYPMPECDRYHHPPDYCHDIKAAWEVVEKMLPGIGIWNESGVWVVSRLDFSGLGETLGEADTAPMALCKAFLKLP